MLRCLVDAVRFRLNFTETEATHMAVGPHEHIAVHRSPHTQAEERELGNESIIMHTLKW